jgi:outer membrane murein-binding lipoprotein Lpp
MKLSKLSDQVKELAQKLAILGEKVERNLSQRKDQGP